MQSMFWYNPTTSTEEERQVPQSDDLAVSLLDGDQDSAQYIATYKEYRTSNGILEALIETGGKKCRALKRDAYVYRKTA